MSLQTTHVKLFPNVNSHGKKNFNAEKKYWQSQKMIS